MENIHFHNEALFHKKKEKIKSQGLEKLHIVSDFDRTLTKSFYQGKKIPSPFALFREGGYLTEEYPQKALHLFHTYHPIEKDDSLDYEFRFHKMQEWWEKHMKLLMESGIHQTVIDEVIKTYPKIFREGIFSFLEFLHTHNIPLLLFSSGIGNLITGYLNKENKLTSNIHIISNMFHFNENGSALGYNKNIIHVMNKSETKIEETHYLDIIRQKINIILLGDSIEDLGMIHDIPSNILITIGFLNENEEEKLELYTSKFDVVITHDGDLHFVNTVLQSLI
jgi:5'-nucleotidase